jgi:hypothetical protein
MLTSLERQIGLTQRDVNAQQFAAAASRANIGRAEAQFKQSTDTLNRIEPLLAQEFVTAEQVDQARTAKRTAEAALEAAQQDARRAQAAVSGVDALVARLGELRAAVASAEYDLQQTTMRAPFDGRVVDLDIAEGEYAATGRRLFTLVDTRNWYVIANFRETELKNIKPGMPADVYLMIDSSKRLSRHGALDRVGCLARRRHQRRGIAEGSARDQLGARRPAFSGTDTHRGPAARPVPHRRIRRGGDSAGKIAVPRQRGCALTEMHVMTTAAPALDAPKRAPSWPEFLRAELAPTPGRLNATIRIVVATAIVLITSMTLEFRSSACRRLSLYF